jgi:large subunit ribosomal protein L4
MELQILKQDGTEAGRTAQLDPRVFDVEPNDHVLWLDVRRIRTNARQGTAKTKERNEIAGSTRKLYRQKGTGHARAGDAKSPIRKTGGRAHGPRPRNYHNKINKKTRDLAQRSALTYKAREGALHVVEGLAMDAPSTRGLSGVLSGLGLDGKKVLILTAAYDQTLLRSAGNLKKVLVHEARDVSTYDLLNAEAIVLQEEALEILTGRLTARLRDAAPAAA